MPGGAWTDEPVRLIFASPVGEVMATTLAEAADGAARWRRNNDETASQFVARVIADSPETATSSSLGRRLEAAALPFSR